jgi:hypothetical protein
VQYEIDRALEMQEKFRCSVIPILVGDVPVPEKLTHINVIDLRQDVESGLSKLLKIVTTVVTEVTPIGEEHEVIWSRRKFDGPTKTTGTAIFASVPTTGKRAPAFVAILFKLIGDYPAAALVREQLPPCLAALWKRARENKWELSLTYESIATWMQLTDATMGFIKTHYGSEADKIGGAVAVIQAIGDLCAVAHVGNMGAFASHQINEKGDRAYDIGVNAAPPVFTAKHRTLSQGELINAPIGNLYTPEWNTINPKSTVSHVVNLALDRAYVALFSHEVPQRDMKRFLNYIDDVQALTSAAERICSWQRPAVSEASCVIYRRTKPASP